jgi:hypothetical protein
MCGARYVDDARTRLRRCPKIMERKRSGNTMETWAA